MRERHYTGFRIQGAIVLFALVIAPLLLLTGCNDEGKDPQHSTADPTHERQLSLDTLLSQLTGARSTDDAGVQEVLGAHGEALQQKTKEELAKLFRWEYKVIEIDPTLTAKQLEQTLQPLGLDGWECFQAGGTPATPHLVCKRRPQSTLAYLKYIPGF